MSRTQNLMGRHLIIHTEIWPCALLVCTNKSYAASLPLDLHGISELLSREMLLMSITYIGYKKIIPNLMSLMGFCIFCSYLFISLYCRFLLDLATHL